MRACSIRLRTASAGGGRPWEIVALFTPPLSGVLSRPEARATGACSWPSDACALADARNVPLFDESLAVLLLSLAGGASEAACVARMGDGRLVRCS